MAQSDDGDVIDCVDMYHQPALKHAPLGSREIQVHAVAIAIAMRSRSISIRDRNFFVRSSEIVPTCI